MIFAPQKMKCSSPGLERCPYGVEQPLKARPSSAESS